ncbi:4-hydroxyproline epimerase [soil metagenome]
MTIHRVTVVDSHTGNEPTRVVLAGGPDLCNGSLAERARRLEAEHQRWYRLVIDEPRGSSILVGALLVPPTDPRCATGVIYFDNACVIGMCGHGTIGVMVTLAHLGRIVPGPVMLETPVGVITATLHDANRVTVRNIPCYRHAANVEVHVDGLGTVVGDIAWGGNWFFTTDSVHEPLDRGNSERLTDLAWRIRLALEARGITGKDGGVIDHIQLVGPPQDNINHSRNFMLCPGKAYDRSPCGTGTSARVACLAADGQLKPGDIWRQESTTGSIFEASYESGPEGTIIPSITGTAFITAEATLLISEDELMSDEPRP